jgi:signal transduction histidine kinase/ActR/RegA family two-component response regulator
MKQSVTSPSLRADQDIESKLLYAAYEHDRLNIVLTIAAAFIMGAVFWNHLPPVSVATWVSALLSAQMLAYLLLKAFQRVQPGPDAIPTWRRLFILQNAVGGAAWALGPTLMASYASESHLVVFLGILFCVCAVAATSLAEQRVAMQTFIAAALLPPAIALAYSGGNIRLLVALVLVSGMGAIIAVGWQSSRALRDLLRTEFCLRVAVAEAERSSQAKSEFLSRMSHDLRTPMNAMLGFAELLEYDGQLNEVQRDNVLHIQRGGRHLLDLINEVLDLATIEAGRLYLKMEPVELASLVAECREMLQTLAHAKGISFHVDEVPSATVRADRVRLRQSLLNLLSNAVKYNRENGSVRVDTQIATDGRVRLTVSDTGAGINTARMHELFQPFNRLDAHGGRIEGTGIGLTIARRLVELMGGSVGVESEVGVGSRFWIELPLANQPKTSATIETEFAPSRPSYESAQRHKVLCVDDNPVNLHLIARMLGKRPNIDVLTADTPQAGIELAKLHRPDLIFLDISMPEMDGYQVLAALKSDANIGSPPVIAVSGNAMPRDIEKAREAGFAHYLTKPFQMAEFLEIVDRSLARTELRA